MRRALSTIVGLLWGLWFGGLITLFMAVVSLFTTFADRRDVAAQGAGHLFHLFNTYQLALAAASLVATFIWCVLGPPRLRIALFALFALATVAACVITMYLVPQIQLLQARGLTQSAEFRRFHGYANLAYIAQTVILFMAGLLLPWVRDDRRSSPQRGPGAAAG